MGYQFGAVEIPIGVPAADQTLAILGKIDERAQLVGLNAARSFGQVASPAIEGFTTNAVEGAVAITHVVPKAMTEVGNAAEGLGHRLSHLGVAGSFALTNLANGSEQGVTRLAHSLALFGGAFSPVGLAITTFVAVAGEQLLDWYKKTSEAADKATESLRKVRDEQRQGHLGSLHQEVNRTEDQIHDLNAEIATKEEELRKARAAPSASRGGKGTRDTSDLQAELDALTNKRTDLISLVQSGKREIAKINDESRKEEERKQKEADDKALAAQKRLQDAGDRLAASGGDHLARTHALINELDERRRDAVERDRVQSEEQFYRDLEVAERDYFAQRRIAREKDLEHQRTVAQQAEELARGTASIISDTITSSLQGGFGAGFGALEDGVMKMIGSLLTRIGETMLAASPFFKAISAALMTLSGEGLAFGGAGLIAIGAALGAGGGGHGGAGSGGRGYGGGFNYGQAVVSTITPKYMPNTQGVTAKQPIQLNMTVFGKRDPTFQRELLEAIAIANQRGSSSG